ncbi:MAG: hypothetical protein M3Q23_15600 [Actinomycetota bacterium]|nr:hypothetical protein [Actinomycetota bacterium]
MATQIPDDLRDPHTPAEVVITSGARRPAADPRLGVDVPLRAEGTPRNRLVAIGDSLTHGFQSAAIYHTDISYPALIAHELGWLRQFRRPHYWGFGGLPLNLEFLVRELEDRFGPSLDWYELPLALFRARQWMAEAEQYWEHGPGSRIPHAAGINHNLAVFGWDLRDTLDRTFDVCSAEMTAPKHQLIPNIENGNNLAALRVLPSGTEHLRGLTPLTAAAELGAEGTEEAPGDGEGIETLIVFLGSNNALSAVTHFTVHWSGAGYDDLKTKGRYNVWRPSHFASEFDLVVKGVEPIRARHVIWTTVPHVTVAPLAHGVGTTKQYPGSRYFANYTWPWIGDDSFHPGTDPHLTHQRARAIDSAIDMYNDHIEHRVREARQAGRDWYLLDVAGMLDRLAYRRYLQDAAAQPSWWTPYPLPPEVEALQVDSRFFRSDKTGRLEGGIFALDGVHPTTVGYGLLAQEFINIMDAAGVQFPHVDRDNPRQGPPRLNWHRVIRRDSLISAPPASLAGDLRTIGWLDEVIEVFQHLFRRGSSA